jgi:pilus assembly protein CpaD
MIPTSVPAPRPFGPLMALVAAGLMLAACNTQGQRISEGLPTDGYRTAYPITIEDAPEILDLPVGRGSTGLSPDLAAVVRSFGADAAKNATSGVAVMIPQGSANAAAASYLSRDVVRTLRSTGLAASLVEVRPYAVADGRANAPLRLIFTRIKAVSPPCGRWTGSVIANDEKGGDGAEFGCTTQANLAAMVENPNDLIIPRAESPIPAWQRWKSMQKFEGGSSSGSTSSSSSGG